jgi:DNA-binding NarL/FixJ family response regulator
MLRVFIADDSDLVRERLAALISELGAIELVGQAKNAREALKAIQRLKPDVAILDIRMPGGSGIQTLRAVKATEAAPVIIMLTAFPYRIYREKCLEAGAEFFFDKTTEFDRVAQVIEQLQIRPFPSI